MLLSLVYQKTFFNFLDNFDDLKTRVHKSDGLKNVFCLVYDLEDFFLQFFLFAKTFDETYLVFDFTVTDCI